MCERARNNGDDCPRFGELQSLRRKTTYFKTKNIDHLVTFIFRYRSIGEATSGCLALEAFLMVCSADILRADGIVPTDQAVQKSGARKRTADTIQDQEGAEEEIDDEVAENAEVELKALLVSQIGSKSVQNHLMWSLRSEQIRYNQC